MHGGSPRLHSTREPHRLDRQNLRRSARRKVSAGINGNFVSDLGNEPASQADQFDNSADHAWIRSAASYLTVEGRRIEGALNLIKGGVGALCGKNIVARLRSHDRDQTTENGRCPRSFPVPVEVIPFGFVGGRRRAMAKGLCGQRVSGKWGPQGKDGHFLSPGGHWLSTPSGADSRAPRLAGLLNPIPASSNTACFLAWPPGLAGFAQDSRGC